MTNELFKDFVEYTKSKLVGEIPKNSILSVYRGHNDPVLIIECKGFRYTHFPDGTEEYRPEGLDDED